MPLGLEDGDDEEPSARPATAISSTRSGPVAEHHSTGISRPHTQPHRLHATEHHGAPHEDEDGEPQGSWVQYAAEGSDDAGAGRSRRPGARSPPDPRLLERREGQGRLDIIGPPLNE